MAETTTEGSAGRESIPRPGIACSRGAAATHCAKNSIRVFNDGFAAWRLAALLQVPLPGEASEDEGWGGGQVRNGLMYHVFAAHDRRRVEVFGFAIR